jgi:soluble lytic murein transglycosylase-like protein
MKFVVIALFLGCTPVVYPLAVRFNWFSLETLLSAQVPETGSSVPQWPAFFAKRQALVGSTNVPEDAPVACPINPPVSKAETLKLIAGASAKHRVPAALVTSIVAAESNFDSTAVSEKGAIGLMQLMPETARQFGADPAVPAENIDAGTHYLRWLFGRYRKRRGAMKCVIAAYNAGPAVVDHYGGVPPFRETRTYVARVLGFLNRFGPISAREVDKEWEIIRRAP